VTVQADGDLVGRSPIRLNVVPGAATFLLPAVR
jgi:diacylglycerol kinase family enzyme